jgi:7,8-dihydroneopterin aldolase/epimerase/oxygenase
MFTIHLKKLKLFAYHGVHDEETIIGTDFEVSVAVSFNAPEKVAQLNDTINYVTIYDIIKLHFAQPEKLLETLAQNITQQIHKIDNRITSINITIDKLNAPISNFIGTVGVTYSKSYF